MLGNMPSCPAPEERPSVVSCAVSNVTAERCPVASKLASISRNAVCLASMEIGTAFRVKRCVGVGELRSWWSRVWSPHLKLLSALGASFLAASIPIEAAAS
jgi:hypothetical protein